MTTCVSNLQTSRTSFNYSLFKVLSILVVISGHWITGSPVPLWIPSTIGLFIFSFSSAFFTASIYGHKLNIKGFWSNKLRRLLVPYWLALSFLAILILVRGQQLFHWHSLLHVFGLSAFLNLFGHNQSALGNGLWFFTILILFYLAYPIIARTFAISGGGIIFPLIATLLFMSLDHLVKVGFSLWLTTLGFVLGIYFGLYRVSMRTDVSLGLTLGSLAAMLGLNVCFGYTWANTMLLTLACVGANLWIIDARIPHFPALRALARLENFLLEIFLIHTYLFFHLTGNNTIDFFVSLGLIILTAWILKTASLKLQSSFFSSRPPRISIADIVPVDLDMPEQAEYAN